MSENWTREHMVEVYGEAGADAMRKLSDAYAEIERLQGLLTNVERRQADVRREVKALNIENRRLRDEQPDRVRMEKRLAHLKSSLARCEHKCAHLTRVTQKLTPEHLGRIERDIKGDGDPDA